MRGVPGVVHLRGRGCGDVVYVRVAHQLMTSSRVVLGEIISQVTTTWLPGDIELALPNSVANPVESHVYGLGPAVLDSVVGEAHSAAVVAGDVGATLWVAHVGECLP